MRKLMWFTLGFGAACAWGAYCGNPYWLTAALILTAAAVGCFVLGRNREYLRAVMVLFVGCVVGLCWFRTYDALYLKSAGEMDGRTCVATIRSSSFLRETDYGYAFDGSIQLEGKEYQVTAYLDRGEEPITLTPGDRVVGESRFRLTTDGGSGEPTYHQGKGTFLLAYQTGDVTVIPASAEMLRDLPAILRQDILEMIETFFPADTFAFAKALLLGDGSDLSYEMDTAFKVSGIRHIIAVSGLHVSILFSMIYLISGKKRVLTSLIGIPLVMLFAAVAGFTPSVTRACLMQILMMLAMLFEQEYDPPTALSFAALVMLAVNPLVITSVSFQLSVGCMAGIFLFAGRTRAWMLSPKRLGEAKGKGIKARLKRWFAGSVSVSLAAMVLTTPLCAWYFGTVSLIGVVTNLLTLWLVTYIFYGIILACLMGSLWLPLGTAVAWIVSWGIRFVQWLALTLTSIPLAAVYTESVYIVIWLVMCYVLLVLYLCMKKKPAGVFACCMVLGLCVSLLISWLEPLLDNCRVTVLDVEQGQCILLQSEGRTYLVDCGGNGSESVADKASQTLLSQGVSRLDGMILTHYDADHAGGAANLLTRVDADAVFVPDVSDEDGVAEALAAQTDGQMISVNETVIITYGTTKLTIFPPLKAGTSNESSMCVLFQAGNCDILITGDRDGLGERMLLRTAQLPELEVLIAGHHGSKSSTCEELLRATTPEYVFISVGADNRYGHPDQEVLDRLEDFGCIVCRTDRDGTITFRR